MRDVTVPLMMALQLEGCDLQRDIARDGAVAFVRHLAPVEAHTGIVASGQPSQFALSSAQSIRY